MSQPWLKFYPSDWRSDPALRVCSIGARGLWMEMLCIMHEAVPRGSLLVNGRPVTDRQLANLCGVPARDAAALLSELDEAGVFSRDPDGTIFSRRIRRDTERSAEGRSDVKRKWGEGDSPHRTRSQRMAAAREKGRHTAEEWSTLLAVFRGKCVKCGNDDGIKDHIKPVYQGGSDAIDNLQPMCRSCNAAKGPECDDLRDKAHPGWRSEYEKRLAERLGSPPKTPTQKPEARSQKEDENARAGEARVEIANEILESKGLPADAIEAIGLHHQVQSWLNQGIPRDFIVTTSVRVIAKLPRFPDLKYLITAMSNEWQRACEQPASTAGKSNHATAPRRNGITAAIDGLVDRLEAEAGEGGEVRQAPAGLLSDGRRH